ncbi:type 1 glutamine amidotransferase domain-containing protein [Palleronia sp. LCG004]|uniref:type 1 glutamine amidotransferase domain-containing protein n=1 Tax=Palleronia sp. LCG004 TaxID=3079304 RepID=UPI002942AB9F|nr:type 1 glutamine amidotransferase domain-containing protein [Palleronia sp. LCG004]WOI55296.1 type 1 glutamine amidotransferase domain-containing protein [Palleronia sp. LCG004]
MPDIGTAKIIIMASDGFEQVELTTPKEQLEKAGATVHVATPDGGEITGWYFDRWGDKIPGDLKISDVNLGDYDAMVLPGGQINPDVLRTDETAVAKIRDFAATGKPLAAICHAPWLLIEADLVRGKRLTSYHSIRTDLKNAGADVVDEQVAIDGNLITSRNPDDLDAFCKAVIDAVETKAQAA